MTDVLGIRVFFSSKTIGGFKGREGFAPVCHACEKRLGKNNELIEFVPSEAMTLVFSAELASQELGVSLELIDINQLSLGQRMKEKVNGKPIPRLCIGESCITESSKDEIIAFYYNVHRLKE